MTDTHVASNTRAHENHPGPKKKSAKQPRKKDDDATAESVSSRGLDHIISKTAAPPFTFPTTYQPSNK